MAAPRPVDAVRPTSCRQRCADPVRSACIEEEAAASIHPPIRLSRRSSSRPSLRPRHLAAVAAAVIGLLGATLAFAPVAVAQPASAAAAAGTAYDGLPSAQQAALFSRQVASGELARLSDAQVLAVFQALQPDALLKWARAEMNRYPEYEYWMSRQERLNGQWQEQPARMQVRYRHAPRQLYAKWLPGGAQAGQEILYDETRR
ncbi:conserved protein of unknown function [Cupriavidus taiwanensis]|uniref:Uncharacterized protein n=1 Tax=Cupriavidus taiwanensis TaxID=164546 RepID=A0A375IH06_9BURK|nr:conserved protein of unknown function [Cupriavidus taiwanensis]